MRVSAASLVVYVVLLATLGLTHPAAAAALEPGVHVDPGSPAAKEYALPLSQARHTGAPPSPGGRPSSTLFGEGIGSRGSASARRSASRTSSASARSKRGDRGGAVRDQQRPAVSVARTRSSPDSSGSLIAALGGAVLILALGTVGGVILRGRRSAPST